MKVNLYAGASKVRKQKGENGPFIMAVCPRCETKNFVNYKKRVIHCSCEGDAMYVKEEQVRATD